MCVYGGFLREALRILLNSRKSQLDNGTKMISKDYFEKKIVEYLDDNDIDLLWTQPVDSSEFEQLIDEDQQLDQDDQLKIGQSYRRRHQPE